MSPISTNLLLLLLLPVQLTIADLPSCYAPDGSLSPGDGYLPCINTLNVESMCCVLNVTALHEVNESISQMDTCLPSGLCETSDGLFLRNYCTDPTWQSPNCLNVCTDGSDGGAHNNNTFMTQCPNGSWCCGAKNNACCNAGQSFQLAASIAPFAVTSTATGSTALATGTAAVTSPAISSTVPSPPPGSSGISAAVSIGLGVALALVVVGAGIAVFVMRRRLRRAREREAYAAAGGSEVLGGVKSSELEQLHMAHEVPASGPPAEMDGGPVARNAPRSSWRWL